MKKMGEKKKGKGWQQRKIKAAKYKQGLRFKSRMVFLQVLTNEWMFFLRLWVKIRANQRPDRPCHYDQTY